MTEHADVAGIDVDNVTRWLTERAAALSPPLRFDVITGGRSNLTYRIGDADGRSWVLRRPPLHSVLPSAHDMAREYRIISALWTTDVPVPRTIGLCEDESVIGADFYVMDFVDGHVLVDEQAARSLLDEPQRRRSGESLIDVLVRLHAVDPDAVGLGRLGRKEAYIERQLRRWHGQWQDSKTRDLPAMEEVYERLRADIPEQGAATIVHGDYRLDNVIVSPEGDLRAVLDWELCTLGDPLADVGLLMVYWSERGDDTVPLGSAPSLAPGFCRRDELLQRYAEGSGRDLSELDFYVAFGSWKLAAILEGVYARHASGAYGETDDSYQEFPKIVERLAESAERAAIRAGR